LNDLNSELEPREVDPTDLNSLNDLAVASDSKPDDLVRDPFEPPDDIDIGSVEENPPEHLLNRLRVILWGPHQTYVFRMLLVALILMTIFFSYRWYIENGLVDIDQANSIHAEFKVDINSAELGEIVVLPGIGIKLAQAIVDHRNASGDFESLDEICEVPGIGEKTLDTLKPYLLPIKPVRVSQ
jgi:competence ComEA-like helix-hairpin-helix protein